MAAGSYERKQFTGGAQPTSLNAAISGSPSSFTVASSGGASFPDGSVGPFVVVIDRDTATEEKILVTSRVGDQFNIATRGYDDTSAENHDIGAVVEHVLDASTVDQANRYTNLQTTKGDLVAHDGTNAVRVAAGANDSLLVADSTVSAGLAYKSIGTLGLATTSYVTTAVGNEESARITADASEASTRADADTALQSSINTITANDWVTTARVANANITKAKLEAALPRGVQGKQQFATTSFTDFTNYELSLTLEVGRLYYIAAQGSFSTGTSSVVLYATLSIVSGSTLQRSSDSTNVSRPMPVSCFAYYTPASTSTYTVRLNVGTSSVTWTPQSAPQILVVDIGSA